MVTNIMLAALERVKLPEKLDTIWFYAFKGCTSLAKIDLPRSLTKIAPGAFEGCDSLKSVTLPRQNIVRSRTSFPKKTFIR